MAKVLIIEDEMPLVKILRRIIGDMGHDVLTATDGREGLKLAADESVDIITSDLQMPGEPSGLDLIRRMRDIRPDCPIIIISGHPSAEIMKDCEGLGVIDFLTKPYEVSFVRDVINGALKNTAAQNSKGRHIVA